MAAALPVIAAIGQIAGVVGGVKSVIDSFKPKPAAPPVLSYDQAMSQAQNSLNPIYDKQVSQTLAALDKGATARGFYGQAPADAFNRSTAAQIRGDQASAIANLGAQMQNQSAAQASQFQQNAIANAQQQSNAQYQQAMATGQWQSNNPFQQLMNLGQQAQGMFGNRAAPSLGGMMPGMGNGFPTTSPELKKNGGQWHNPWL